MPQLAALREQGFSRRQFIKGPARSSSPSSVAEFAEKLGISREKMLAQGGNTPQTLDSWVAIGADGNVTVYTGRATMDRHLHRAGAAGRRGDCRFNQPHTAWSNATPR